MNRPAHRLLTVTTYEDVGAARREVAAVAVRLPGVRPGEAALVVTELATNLVRHTTSGGYLLYREAGGGIELLAVDQGPGMAPADPPGRRTGRAQSLDRPRRTHSGGLGVGLDSVARLSASVDGYSSSAGTVVLAHVGDPPATNGAFRWGAVNVPRGGDGESGDAWAVAADDGLAAVVVDGLGHGSDAAAAARSALAVFDEGPVTDLGGFLRRTHDAMRATRGGVVGVCHINPDRNELSYATVGNISGRVLTGQDSHSLPNQVGMVGTEMPLPQARVATRRWPPAATLILTSDGIRSGWDPNAYPGLRDHDPAVVAATLQRDHSRTTDDATVLVVQDTRGDDTQGDAW